MKVEIQVIKLIIHTKQITVPENLDIIAHNHPLCIIYNTLQNVSADIIPHLLETLDIIHR